MSRKKSVVLNIVVVDDSEYSRKSVTEILEGAGYNVVGTASNAEEAVQLSATVNANLWLIDVVMPDVSGIELSKLVSEKKMNVYIIMMSSLNMESIIIESISNGAIDFLQKPFDKKMLLSSVEKIAQLIENEV
ncbi:MAG: hypothetical protein COW00_03070 [Bdellovibrio sp. CG12_big_fil_rev_8_21_14_0_65_39_13]|nr:MAG: hypothetical protein COW78_19200 [Bdellovibrio sp. CG22_combo_CG10-13_8_21_14_all_39_27]PIQ61673.1 MAG: hypothetical protein COW00_03070 [Bdellovibrio sp. CG12_big_fil_rev_8_21_14_0_65_39_13]PIR35617.1 MAG: hypothetical protein COV37_07460 [Bdellovibrio sp. CG11_big_fil_rev_8_21_14_0_20_39_38]PJB52532.1 MAG: hypothetical protein CO099_12125 [Bdellovibrio sp. CG_4_9_14_3_um_filter_39_7]